MAADRAHGCDRACLKSTLDRYLAAVLNHDPSAAVELVMTVSQGWVASISPMLAGAE